MITSLRLINFKSFEDETLRLGPFSVVVGSNASGKSNIRDAFRILHGIGRGYTLAETIGGKYGAGGQVEWNPIRGASNEIARLTGYMRPKRTNFSIQAELSLPNDKYSYSITVRFDPSRSDVFRVVDEELSTDSMPVFKTISSPTKAMHTVVLGPELENEVSLSRSEPALTQLMRPRYRRRDSLRISHRHLSMTILTLGNIRFLEFSPDVMRMPSTPGVTTLGNEGQNLPSVLQAICEDPEKESVLASWLRELTPMDVIHFDFPRDPNGRIYLHLVEPRNRAISAYSASDGTLRFLGILAALLSNDPTSIYFFEEIDSGIHPARLTLLLEMLQLQNVEERVQIITTTHSPDLLSLIDDEMFYDTSVVYRDEYSRNSVICPIADLPDADELRHIQGLGRLHSTGWMEHMVAFARDDGERSSLE